MEHQINQAIRTNPEWREIACRVETVSGIGEMVAATLVANLPELGQLSRQGQTQKSRPNFGKLPLY